MKFKLLLTMSLFFSFCSIGQEVIATQGDSYSNGATSVDFTIGEVVINTGTNGANDITQGFHQTNWNFLGIEDHAPDFEVNVYPNPMSDVLNIKTSVHDDVSYSLYDSRGRLVLEDKLSSDLTPIEVSHLTPGNYSLRLNNSEQILKTIKLVKVY